jgi:hypothetical protein
VEYCDLGNDVPGMGTEPDGHADYEGSAELDESRDKGSTYRGSYIRYHEARTLPNLAKSWRRRQTARG